MLNFDQNYFTLHCAMKTYEGLSNTTQCPCAISEDQVRQRKTGIGQPGGVLLSLILFHTFVRLTNKDLKTVCGPNCRTSLCLGENGKVLGTVPMMLTRKALLTEICYQHIDIS